MRLGHARSGRRSGPGGYEQYLPDGAGFYVHINVQQFLAAPVVRKAIPLAAKTYEDAILQGASLSP